MNGIRRALPSVLVAAAVLSCTFFIERPRACPVYIPPQPLRTLYKLSERVVVARVGAREVLSRDDDLASVRIALHVTENLKGSPAEVLHLYRSEFVVNEADEARREEETVVVLTSSGREAPRLKRGERYLFFLDPRKEGGYEVNDAGYGIKTFEPRYVIDKAGSAGRHLPQRLWIGVEELLDIPPVFRDL